MENLKKLIILSIILFNIFLINSDKVLAYGEEVSPMLDLDNINLTINWLEKPSEVALNSAEEYVKNNCSSYQHYLITNARLSVGTNGVVYPGAKVNLICWNDEELNNIKFRFGSYSGGNDVGAYFSLFNNKTTNKSYNQVLIDNEGNILKTYSFDTKILNVNFQLLEDSSNNPNDNIYLNNNNESILDIPYIKSNLEVLFDSSKDYSYGSYYYKSVKYNNLIYNDYDKIINFENGDFVSPTSFEYEISEGTNQGKKLILYFKHYESTDYAYIYNYQTGKKILLDNLDQNTTMTFDDIALDNTYQINIYNGNDELIKDETIDIQQELFISEDRYILIRNLNVKELNSYTANYFNTKDTDKCFYKYKDEEEKEINCNSQTAMITSPNKNTYVEHYIKDKNDKIVVKKNVNLNYLTDLPLFKFKSYFDEKNNVQVLEIITENLKESDIISYSYDNENFYILETKRINYLNFYISSNIYLKLERNSEIIAEGYFDVIYNSYVNSSNNNNLENTNFSFKNLLNNFKNITNNDFTLLKKGTEVYNNLKNSPLGLYISIIITGSFIILIINAIKR